MQAAIRDASVLSVAAAVALVWTFVDVARAVGAVVTSAFVEYPEETIDAIGAGEYDPALTWEVGDRVIAFEPLVQTGIAFGVALLAAAIVLGQRPRL